MTDSVGFVEESTNGSLKYSASSTDYGYDDGYYYEAEAPMEAMDSPMVSTAPSTALANAKLVYTLRNDSTFMRKHIELSFDKRGNC